MQVVIILCLLVDTNSHLVFSYRRTALRRMEAISWLLGCLVSFAGKDVAGRHGDNTTAEVSNDITSKVFRASFIVLESEHSKGALKGLNAISPPHSENNGDRNCDYTATARR